MKLFPSIFLSAIGLLTLAVAGFGFTNNLATPIESKQVESRTVDSFDKIEIGGSFEVIIQKGPQSAIQLEGNNLENVKLEVKNSTLSIGFEKDNWKNPSVEVRLTVPELYAISLAGSSTVIADGPFGNEKTLNLEIAGSGNMMIEVNAKELVAGIAGSGSLTCVGKADEISVDIAGSGDYNGKELKGRIGKVSIAGSGDTDIYTSEKCWVEVAGSGRVHVYGNPEQLKESIAGSGSVKRK